MKWYRILVMIFLLSLALACGSNATPEKVGSASEPKEEVKEEPEEEAVKEEAPTKEEPAQEEPTATPEPEPTATPEPAPTQQTVFNAGDIVSIGDSVLVVLGWENIEENDFSKPDAGNKFIAVEIVIVNQGDSSASISSGLQTELKDAESRRYQPDFMADTVTGSGGINGELAPGERVRGKVGFQIPEGAQGLQLGFDAEIFGTGKVVVNLPAEPAIMEPPAEIAGETTQAAYAIGDIVEIGTLTITVNEVKDLPASDMATPEEGNKFLAVDVTIENKGTEPAAISGGLQMKLKDSSGQQYGSDFMAAMAASGGASVDGELAPGEKVRGNVPFQVPMDATGLQFEFDASIFGSGKVQVALQ